jgi:hypothetical protein
LNHARVATWPTTQNTSFYSALIIKLPGPHSYGTY